MTEQLFDKQTVAGCINSATFWLEGLVDGSNITLAEAIVLISLSISDLIDAKLFLQRELEFRKMGEI